MQTLIESQLKEDGAIIEEKTEEEYIALFKRNTDKEE